MGLLVKSAISRSYGPEEQARLLPLCYKALHGRLDTARPPGSHDHPDPDKSDPPGYATGPENLTTRFDPEARIVPQGESLNRIVYAVQMLIGCSHFQTQEAVACPMVFAVWIE